MEDMNADTGEIVPLPPSDKPWRLRECAAVPRKQDSHVTEDDPVKFEPSGKAPLTVNTEITKRRAEEPLSAAEPITSILPAPSAELTPGLYGQWSRGEAGTVDTLWSPRQLDAKPSKRVKLDENNESSEICIVVAVENFAHSCPGFCCIACCFSGELVVRRRYDPNYTGRVRCVSPMYQSIFVLELS